MGKSYFDTNFDAQYDRALQMRQNALLQEQNDLLEQAQEEARNRERTDRIFQQGQAKLLELAKYAAERGLIRVEVYPVLGDLGEYKREIITAALKPYNDYCGQLAKEDRYFNGQEYYLVMNRKIKLGDINGIAKTHKEPFVVVTADAGLFYVLPMDTIHAITGDGYEGKDVDLPQMSQILFLKQEELPVVAQMLVNAKNGADRAAKTITESAELKDVEEKIKNIPEKKAGGCLGSIGKALLFLLIVLGFLIGCGALVIKIFSVDMILLGAFLGLVLGIIIAVKIFKQIWSKEDAKENKIQKQKDELLNQKKETISRIISESLSFKTAQPVLGR